MPPTSTRDRSDYTVYVLDLDGTLADDSDRRNKYLRQRGGVKDWDSYFDPEEVIKDPLMPIAKMGLQRLALAIKADRKKKRRNRVIFLTGRPESTRKATLQWLEKHVLPLLGKVKTYLLMRPENDFTSNKAFKEYRLRLIHRKYTGAKFYYVDDDPALAEMYRAQPGLYYKSPEDWNKFLAA